MSPDPMDSQVGGEGRVRPTCRECGFADNPVPIRHLDTHDFRCPECGSIYFDFPAAPAPDSQVGERCPTCGSTVDGGVITGPHPMNQYGLPGSCPDPFHSPPVERCERCGACGADFSYGVPTPQAAREAHICPQGDPCPCGHAPQFCHRLNAKKWCPPFHSPPVEGDEGERWTIYVCDNGHQGREHYPCLVCGLYVNRVEVVPAAERDELRARLERVEGAWEWAMNHLRYAAPEQYPIAAQEGFRRLDHALGSPTQQSQ